MRTLFASACLLAALAVPALAQPDPRDMPPPGIARDGLPADMSCKEMLDRAERLTSTNKVGMLQEIDQARAANAAHDEEGCRLHMRTAMDMQ